MSQTKVEKNFDCLKFKQQAQEKISEEIQNLTPTEQIEYFRQKAESRVLWVSGGSLLYPDQRK
jgi:hypothetical protein